MVQRIACAMIAGALSVVSCLVALLLSGALPSERLPLAFCAACVAGVFLVPGLVILERGSVPQSGAAFERRRR